MKFIPYEDFKKLRRHLDRYDLYDPLQAAVNIVETLGFHIEQPELPKEQSDHEAAPVVRKISEYKIVAGESIEHFAHKVTIEIIRGWQPLGGMTANTANDEEEWFYQTMVKYDI